MLDNAVSLMFQGAKVYWPSLTSDMFREAACSFTTIRQRCHAVEQMEKLLRAELLARLGPPVIPFPA